MKKFATLMAMFMVAAYATVVLAAAPAGPIVIKEMQKDKGPVTFDHAKHASQKCNVCHHKSDEKGTNAEKCSKCHGAKAEGKKVSLKDAFHKHCKDCHAKEKKGPTACDKCHSKK